MSSKDNFIAKNEHLKCAPSKLFSDGSCFTVDSLKKLATTYNKYMGSESNKLIKMPDTLIDSELKIYLVQELTKKISECGNDQLCWLDLNWVKQTKDDDILKNTFRPKGPQGRFKWLSTTNINEIMIQYEEKFKNFKFLGAVPCDFQDLEHYGIQNLDLDELNDKGINILGIVINLDEHYKRGSHWVSMYTDLSKNQVFYFDSYGLKPKKKIADFVKKIALWCYKRHKLNIQKDGVNDNLDTDTRFMGANKNKYENILNIDYNKTRHQFKNSECGVYSVNFILRLLNGEIFENICKNITPDDKVNECRDVYFRFK